MAFVWIQSDRLFWDAALIPKLLLLRLILFLVAVRVAFDLRAARWFPRSLVALAGAFLLWSLISALAGETPRVSLLGEAYRYEGFIAFAGYFLLFFYGWLEGRRSGLSAVRAGSVILAVAAGAVGLLAIIQQISPGADSAFAVGGAVRSWGTFGNPLYLALFGCLFVPLLAVLAALRENDLLTRTLCALGGALLLAGTIASFSRAAWLALPLACLAVAFLVTRTRLRRSALALTLGVTVAVALTTLAVLSMAEGGDQGMGGRLTELWSGEGTVGTRIEMYKGAAELIGEQPVLGWGFGTYGAEAVRVRTEPLVAIEGSSSYPDRPHSSLLYIAYSTGLPGALLYTAFLVAGLVMLVRRARSQRGAGRLIAAGGLAGVLAYLLAELTVFSTIEVTPLAFLLLGWLLGFSGQKDGDDRRLAKNTEDLKGSWWPRRLLPVAAVLLPLFFLAGTAHAITAALADASYNRVLQRAATQEPEIAAEGARFASRLEPHVAEYWNTQAALYTQAAEQLDQPALLEKSKVVLTEGLQRLPDHPLLVVSLTDVLLRQGEYRQAIVLADRHLGRDRFSGDTNFNKAMAHIGLGEYQLAAAALERAVAINPRDSEALVTLAGVYTGLGQDEAASRAREQALKIDPNLKGGSG